MHNYFLDIMFHCPNQRSSNHINTQEYFLVQTICWLLLSLRLVEDEIIGEQTLIFVACQHTLLSRPSTRACLQKWAQQRACWKTTKVSACW